MQNLDSDILSRLSFWSVAFPDKCAVLYFISITAFSQKIITKIDKLSLGVLEYSRCGDLYQILMIQETPTGLFAYLVRCMFMIDCVTTMLSYKDRFAS